MPSNNFLVELLKFQQDGELAISAPANWTIPPLLEVRTEIDETVEELSGQILQRGGANAKGRWHFFVGSPGNGKSAAIGKLCRALQTDSGCEIRTEEGTPLQALPENTVPYLLEVYEEGCRFPSVQILQDASVVRNPFRPDIDPANELINAVRSAWGKGVSLVICTNRGVLEKAYRDHHLDRIVNSEPWFKVIAEIVNTVNYGQGKLANSWSFEGGKSVFGSVDVSYTFLDTRSLIIGAQTFEGLIIKAVDEAHWTGCGGCEHRNVCPFHANREWLKDEEARAQFLTIMRRAEAFSGQAFVFREVLALVSLILAGCPRDFEEVHPCEWVSAKAQARDFFSLCSRRVYMSLFASSSPFGLEADEELRRDQLNALRGFLDSLPERYAGAIHTLKQVIEGQPPSADVGVPRLLAKNGILAEIDLWNEPLPLEFAEDWDRDFDALFEIHDPLFSDLERECVAIWRSMEEAIERSSGPNAVEEHRALRRWSTNFLIHFGALRRGCTAWGEELDRFVQLLMTLSRSQAERSSSERRQIRELDARLEKIIGGGELRESECIPLAENVVLSGRWARDHLRPSVDDEARLEALACTVRFDGGERASLSAPAFVWLEHLCEHKLNPSCFPLHIISGARDARQRAAAQSGYSRINSDVELRVSTPAGKSYKLIRDRGSVEVDSQ